MQSTFTYGYMLRSNIQSNQPTNRVGREEIRAPLKTPAWEASLFAVYVYLRLHVAIKHSVKPTHEQSILSSSSWQGAVKELNIYPTDSVSVALVAVYATFCQSDHLIETKTVKNNSLKP